MRKRFLTLALALAACLSMTFAAQAATAFSDVPTNHWAYSEIQKCCDKGIVNGYTNGTFKPANTVTGAQFAAMLTRMFYPSELAANNSLTSQGWYMPSLYTAYTANLLTGTSRLASGRSDNWKSSANLNLNRYDMAQMLNNILVAHNVTASTDSQNAARDSIKDWSSIPSQYQKAVLNCYALGVLNGMRNGTFSGSSTMNRAQACAVINREITYVGEGSTTTTGAVEQLDFSDSYKASKYYTALKNVTLTGDYRQDIMNIAASQIGYHESSSENKLDGSSAGNGNYSEYGRALGSNGSAWCSEFASWCVRQANVPTSILNSSSSASIANFAAPYYTWSQTSYAGGSYTPQPGDLALFAWTGTSLNEPHLSHTAIVSGVKQEGNTVYLSVIHGNANDSVRRDVYTLNASNGNCSHGNLGYFVAPNYGPSSVQNYDPNKDQAAVAPEPTIKMVETLTLAAGNTGSVQATTNQSGATVTYTSSNQTVATVDRTGKVTAKAAGTSVITASVTVNGKRATATCKITVTASAAELKISPTTLSLEVGKTGTIQATLPSGITSVSYTSSDTSVAAVSLSGTAGTVTAKKAGTAVITAGITVNGKNVTATCKVTVTGSAQTAKTTEEMSAEVITLVNQERAKQGLAPLGTLTSLTAAAQVRAPELVKLFEHTRPDGRTCFTALDEARVSYYTAGENIAAGQPTPESVMSAWMNSPGHKANILQKNFTHIGVACYKSGNSYYWVQMFVGSNAASEGTGDTQAVSLSISPETLELEVNETGSVKASLSSGSAAVTYSSSNSAVATVSSSGLVTAKKAGTATITASATVSGKRYTATCTVTVKASQTASTAQTPEQQCAEIVRLVNEERAKVGLSPLSTLPNLTAAAQVRAVELNTLFSHTRPDGRLCDTAFAEAGVTDYINWGENAAQSGSAQGAMTQWMNSSGHKANILTRDFTHIGVGCVEMPNGRGYSYIQMFITASSSSSGSDNTTNPTPAVSLTISPESLELEVNETGSVKASLSSGSATITYTSSNSTVATVSSSGDVTAKNAGTATITASATVSGKSYTAACTVTVTASQTPVDPDNTGSGDSGSSGQDSDTSNLLPSLPESQILGAGYRVGLQDGTFIQVNVQGSRLVLTGLYTGDRDYRYALIHTTWENISSTTPIEKDQQFSTSIEINEKELLEFFKTSQNTICDLTVTLLSEPYNGGGYTVSPDYEFPEKISLALDKDGKLTLAKYA